MLYKRFLPLVEMTIQVIKKKTNFTVPRFSLPPVLFLLSVLLFTSAGCSDDKLKPTISSLNEQEAPTQESWNSKIYFTEEGNLKAVLFTNHLRMYEERMETLLDGVKIDFYSNEGVKTTTLTSKKGRVDDKTKNMFAIDSVVAVNDSGTTLRTNELMWRNKDQKIVSDKFVTIESPKETIQGYGFESDQSLKNYVIYKITYITTTNNAAEPVK